MWAGTRLGPEIRHLCFFSNIFPDYRLQEMDPELVVLKQTFPCSSWILSTLATKQRWDMNTHSHVPLPDPSDPSTARCLGDETGSPTRPCARLRTGQKVPVDAKDLSSRKNETHK